MTTTTTTTTAAATAELGTTRYESYQLQVYRTAELRYSAHRHPECPHRAAILAAAENELANRYDEYEKELDYNFDRRNR